MENNLRADDICVKYYMVKFNSKENIEFGWKVSLRWYSAYDGSSDGVEGTIRNKAYKENLSEAMEEVILYAQKLGIELEPIVQMDSDSLINDDILDIASDEAEARGWIFNYDEY